MADDPMPEGENFVVDIPQLDRHPRTAKRGLTSSLCEAASVRDDGGMPQRPSFGPRGLRVGIPALQKASERVASELEICLQ